MIPPLFALFAYLPLVLFIIGISRQKHIGVTIAMLVGVMFLPEGAGVNFPIITDLNKYTLASYGCFIAVLIVDRGVLLRFKPTIWDIPIVIWCIYPFISGILTGYSAAVSLGSIDEHIVYWGIPYFLGRLYFTDIGKLRDLCVLLIVAGLGYSLLVLFEVRMSPQLHNIFYGYYPHSWLQVRRWGGWRPSVFFQHGLSLSMFMVACAVVAYWLARSKQIGNIQAIPTTVIAVFLTVVCILCKSTGAICVLFMSLLGYSFSRIAAFKHLVLIGLLIPTIFVHARALGWDAAPVVSLVGNISEPRMRSLKFRVAQENRVRELVRPNIFIGLGPKSKYRQVGVDKEGRVTKSSDLLTDSMWIIFYGKFGLIGLLTMSMMYTLPAIYLFHVAPPNSWTKTAFVFPAALSIISLGHMIDNMFNSMYNPIFSVAAGAVISFCHAYRRNEIALDDQSNHLYYYQPALPAQPTYSIQTEPGKQSSA